MRNYKKVVLNVGLSRPHLLICFHVLRVLSSTTREDMQLNILYNIVWNKGLLQSFSISPRFGIFLKPHSWSWKYFLVLSFVFFFQLCNGRPCFLRPWGFQSIVTLVIILEFSPGVTPIAKLVFLSETLFFSWLVRSNQMFICCFIGHQT